MLWPVMVLIGFLILVALVIALGTRSTALYERASRDRPAPRPPAPRRRVGPSA